MKEGTLLFMKKHAVKIAIGVAVIALLVMGYQMGAKKEAMRTAKIFEERAETIEKAADTLIKAKEKENKLLEADNREKDKVITKTKADNVKLIQKRKEDAVKMEELERKIDVAPPETLLGITRRIMGTDEIWWNEETQMFEFSLAAFRVVTKRLNDWEDFTLNREPSYKRKEVNDAIMIAELNGKIINLQTEVGNFKISLKASRDSYGDLRDAFDEFKRAVKKNPGLLVKLLWSAIGYGAGATFGN